MTKENGESVQKKFSQPKVTSSIVRHIVQKKIYSICYHVDKVFSVPWKIKYRGVLKLSDCIILYFYVIGTCSSTTT